jgi:hypothetical protein
MRVIALIGFFVWGLLGYFSHLLHKANEKGAKTIPEALAIYKKDYLNLIVSFMAYVGLYWTWTAFKRISLPIGDVTEQIFHYRVNIAPLGATWLGVFAFLWGWQIDSITRALGRMFGAFWRKKVEIPAGLDKQEG